MSDMNALQRDIDSRNRIVSDMDTNFFVEAGAGSGKTTMLVNRMVAMVEHDIPIDKICAITFTKAAAGEFYERFQKMLIKRSSPDYVWEDKGEAGQLPEPTDETRRRCAEALEKIDLCFMGTIDAFCGMVLSEHPSEAGIPSDATIVSDEDAEALYKQEYVKICSGAHGTALADKARAFASFYRNAEDVFVQGETVFMNNRNVHFNYTKPSAADLDSAFAKDKCDLIKVVKFLTDHPEIKYTGNKDSVAAWDSIEDIYKTLNKRWSYYFSSVIYALKALDQIRLLPEAMERYKTTLDGLFEPGGSSGKWLEWSACGAAHTSAKMLNFQYSVSMDFLESCVPVLESAMRDKGRMTFFDYLYYLRNMLRKDAEGDGKLIKYIYNRHRHFLIDEFQDTNPMQAEVFFYLSSEHPVAQWSACVPRPGSMFIVGDPKQSIYRFRSADVNSFLKVKGLFETNGGSILTLTRNFRSTKTLCEHFNRVFAAMLPAQTADQSKFEEIPLPAAKDDEFQGIYTYKAYTASLEKAHPDETDPKQIGKIIETLVDDGKYLIRPDNDSALRKIRYSDIMVITYGKKRLGPIMQYLDSKEIPTRVEGDVPFDANYALLDVFKIYGAVADTGDSAALYGALTGNLIALTKDEILTYRDKGGSVSLKSSFDKEGCSDRTARKVAGRIDELKTLSRKAQRLSPAALFAAIVDDYRVYEAVPAENLEVVYYTLELLRNAERAGTVVSLKDGAGYIAKLLAGESGEERCLSLNDDRDAVHMANLHKVKGLEAPVIILAAAPTFPRSVEKRIIHGDTGSEGYFFRLSRGDYKGFYFSTEEYPEMAAAERGADQAEGKRLVYVAATRARNVLIICDSLTSSFGREVSNSIWKPVMGDGISDFFASTGGPAAKTPAAPPTEDASKLYAEAASECVLNDRSMEAGTYTLVNPSHAHLPSKMSEETEVSVIPEDTGSAAEPSDTQKDTVKDHIFPALLGTMVHKLMEMIVSTRAKANTVAAVTEIIREYRTPATEPHEKELTKTLTEVAKKVLSGGYPQTNGLVQDIIKTLLDADEAYCEVPFCYLEDTAEGKMLWNGVMDVVYLKDGKWHIIDYKTNADGNDLDKKYQAQLEAYKKAFKATTGEDADAYTYHIDV